MWQLQDLKNKFFFGSQLKHTSLMKSLIDNIEAQKLVKCYNLPTQLSIYSLSVNMSS